MNWRQTQLDRLIKMVGGGTPSTQTPLFWNGDIPWVSPKDMSVREIYDSEDHITQEAVENSATQIVPAGSILVVVRSGILVRRIPIGIAQRPLAINQDIKALIPDRRFVDSKFLSYFLESKQQVLLTGFVKRGATVHSLQVDKLRKMPIQLPPISEQRRIAEILDQADALRKKRTEADAKAARILPALFYKMFGDPATNPKGWAVGTLEDVILETQYGTSTRANENGDGIPVLRMNNIDADGYLDLRDLKYIVLPEADAKKYSLATGDILFNRTNSAELVGKTGLWRGQMKAVPASYLIRVRVDQAKAFPEFIWAYMNCPFIKQALLNMARRAIGMANINAKELRSLPLFIPRKEQQVSFAKYLSGIEELRDKRSQSDENIEQLFMSLLHRAFTGDLTTKWRKAHQRELLVEMEAQARSLEVFPVSA